MVEKFFITAKITIKRCNAIAKPAQALFLNPENKHALPSDFYPKEVCIDSFYTINQQKTGVPPTPFDRLFTCRKNLPS
jgi:hypothetical protein